MFFFSLVHHPRSFLGGMYFTYVCSRVQEKVVLLDKLRSIVCINFRSLNTYTSFFSLWLTYIIHAFFLDDRVFDSLAAVLLVHHPTGVPAGRAVAEGPPRAGGPCARGAAAVPAALHGGLLLPAERAGVALEQGEGGGGEGGALLCSPCPRFGGWLMVMMVKTAV